MNRLKCYVCKVKQGFDEGRDKIYVKFYFLYWKSRNMFLTLKILR